MLDLDSYGNLELSDIDGRTVLVERTPYDVMQLTSPGRLEQFIVPTRISSTRYAMAGALR